MTTYKVLAFDNGDVHPDARIDLTREFARRDSLTVDEVRVLVPYDDWRVEVRYKTSSDKKYRFVIYNADVPSPKEVLGNESKKTVRADFPLAATLSTADDVDGSKHGIDVTAHVQKFAGPARDWHARIDRVKMKHMFVGDDPETKTIWYPYLHMRTISGLRSYRIDN